MRIKAKYALVGCYSRHIAFRLQILYSFINQSLDYIPFPTSGTETVTRDRPEMDIFADFVVGRKF
jgi:hypothetical protein